MSRRCCASRGSVDPLPTENGAAIGIDASVDYRAERSVHCAGRYARAVHRRCHGGGGAGRLAVRHRAPGRPPARSAGRPIPTRWCGESSDTVGTNSRRFHATDDLTVLARRLAPRGVGDADATGRHWLIEPRRIVRRIRQAQQWLRAILAARDVARAHRRRRAHRGGAAHQRRARRRNRRRRRISVDCSLTQRRYHADVPRRRPAVRSARTRSPQLDADIAERRCRRSRHSHRKKARRRGRYARSDGLNVLEIRLSRSRPTGGSACH